MTTRDPLSRYYDGAQPSDFTPGEAQALAEELVNRPEYRNPKSRQHAVLSRDVAALFARAYPGTIGANGEVVG